MNTTVCHQITPLKELVFDALALIEHSRIEPPARGWRPPSKPQPAWLQAELRLDDPRLEPRRAPRPRSRCAFLHRPGNLPAAVWLAEALAVEHQCPVGYISLGGSGANLALTMILGRARMSWRRARDIYSAPIDFCRITMAASRLAKAPMYVDDADGGSLLGLAARVGALVAQRQVRSVIVDHVECKTNVEPGSRADDTRDIAEGLRQLALELEVRIHLFVRPDDVRPPCAERQR